MKNPGFYILKENNYSQSVKSVLVIGQVKSGTSILSKIIETLGVSFQETNKICYGNSEFNESLLNSKKIRKIISSYNAQKKQIGIKYAISAIGPNFFRFVAFKYFKYFEKPVVIYISRDPLSACINQCMMFKLPFKKNYYNVINRNIKIFKKISNMDLPVFCVSYEKLISDTKTVVDNIQLFLFKNINDTKTLNACKLISPNVNCYTRKLRPKTHYKGILDIVNLRRISGWILDYTSDTPVKVSLLVNGQEARTTLADKFRKDIKEKFEHSTGNCGFMFDIDEDLRKLITPENEIRIKVLDSDYELSNSPWSFN